MIKENLDKEREIERRLFMFGEAHSRCRSTCMIRTFSARIWERWFILDAVYGPSEVAKVVVGVRPDHEVPTPKIVVAQTGKPGEITLSGTSLDTFKTFLRGAEQELSKLTEAHGSENMPYTRMLVEALRIKE